MEVFGLLEIIHFCLMALAVTIAGEVEAEGTVVGAT